MPHTAYTGATAPDVSCISLTAPIDYHLALHRQGFCHWWGSNPWWCGISIHVSLAALAMKLIATSNQRLTELTCCHGESNPLLINELFIDWRLPS